MKFYITIKVIFLFLSSTLLFGEDDFLPTNEIDARKKFEEHRKLALKGDIVSQNLIGLYFLNGVPGIPQNLLKAKNSFTIAAKGGNSTALFNLGLIHDGVGGNKPDLVEAFKCYKKLADMDFSLAQYKVGIRFYKGEGIQKDYNEAFKYINMSAGQGNVDSMFTLSFFYRKGIGVPKNNEQAFRWINEAIESKNGGAQSYYIFAKFFENGWSVEKSNLYAYVWYTISSLHYEEINLSENVNICISSKENLNISDPDKALAYSIVGYKYFEGDCVKKDTEKGVFYTIKAANLGDPVAQSNYALVLKDGDIVKKNKPLAYAWFSVAAYNDNAKALSYRNELKLDDEDLKESEVLTASLFKKFGIVKNNTKFKYFANKVSTNDHESNQCCYFGKARVNINKKTQTRIDIFDVTDMVRSILLVAGLPQNFVIKESMETSFANAYNVEENGKESRWISFNPYSLAAVKSTSQTNWSLISILAHEIGHHLIGHALDNEGSRPDKELEADKYSGNILAKMGATLEEALSALNLFDSKGSLTHPPTYSRIVAVTQGWHEGSSYAKKKTLYPEYVDPGPYFGVGPTIPRNQREYYITKVNFQRTLERYKFHIENWKKENPDHPMGKKMNWSEADKERWIRWYNSPK